MADITEESFRELINQTKETNKILREDMALESKPDPTKFIKEELVNIAYTRSNLQAAKELVNVEKGETERDLANPPSDAQDARVKLIEEQEKTTKALLMIASNQDMQSRVDEMMGAAAAEEAEKERIRNENENNSMKNLVGIKDGIMNLAKSAKDKVKGGISFLKKFAFGALAIAALAFLNNPKFEEIKNQLLDVIIPALAKLYDNVLKPLGEKLLKALKDTLDVASGKKGLFEAIMENKVVVGLLALYFSKNILGAFKGLAIGVKAIPELFTAIGIGFGKVKAGFLIAKPLILAGLGAIKGFFMTILLPFFTTIVAPIALIATTLFAIKQGIDDFMFELEATGSVWEAVKTGIVSLISNILGIPLELIKDGVSWIIGKIGDIFGLEEFKDAEAFLDKFNIVDIFTEGLTKLGDAVAGIFDSFLNAIQNLLRSPKLKLLGGGFAADALFGTPEEQAAKKKAREEEQKLFEENRISLKEQQKLEKKIEEAKKLKQMKEQQVQASSTLLDPRTLAGPMPSQAAPIVVNAPTSTNVNAPNTTNMSTTSTSMINTDRVSDKLSYVR
jgi:hypothetical protein